MRQNVEVLFAKLEPDAAAPTQGSKSAAGWDLRALEDTVVMKGVSTKIRTGLAVAIPEGWEGQIRSRSSLGAKGMIMPNGVGTIDSDYRGEIGVILINLSHEKFVIYSGERIAQLVISKHEQVKLERVSFLEDSVRGSGGFGSTGKT